MPGEKRTIPPGEGDLLEATVAGLLPEPCRIYKDFADNRWRAYYGAESKSRSWVLRPPREAIQEILVWAWKMHEKETTDKCPIKGLLRK